MHNWTVELKPKTEAANFLDKMYDLAIDHSIQEIGRNYTDSAAFNAILDKIITDLKKLKSS